jgi:predicted cupin superfamily sugar epimerase
MNHRAAELVETLKLAPHPEGGYYRELFRSSSSVTPGDARSERSALTTIYFLLVNDMYSRWHRVRSDEVWHLYEGGPLEVMELDVELRAHSTSKTSSSSPRARVPARCRTTVIRRSEHSFNVKSSCGGLLLRLLVMQPDDTTRIRLG